MKVPANVPRRRGWYRCIALLILKFGLRWEWVANGKHRPFHDQEKSGYRLYKGVRFPGRVWTGVQQRKFLVPA
jgi:hypothetical protein